MNMHECFAPNSPRSFRPSVPLSNTRHHTRRTAPRTRPEPGHRRTSPPAPWCPHVCFTSGHPFGCSAWTEDWRPKLGWTGDSYRLAAVHACNCCKMQYAAVRFFLDTPRIYYVYYSTGTRVNSPSTMDHGFTLAINQSSRLDTGSGRQLGPS